MRSIAKLSAAAALCLIVAGCSGGSATTHSSATTHGSTGSTTTPGSDVGSGAFRFGYLTFERATNLLAVELTPLEDNVSLNSGSVKGMSKAFVKLGKAEKGLAESWHPALVAFEKLKPPPILASVFAATTADARKVYGTLRTIGTVVPATSGTLTTRQFLAGSKDLRAFSTHAQALAADLQKFDKRLGVS